MGFTPDGRSVTWVEGPTIRTIPVSALWKADEKDEDAAEEKEGEAKKKEDPFALDPAVVSIPVDLQVPRARPSGAVVLTNARVLPMTGDTVLENVNIVIERDRITEIAKGATRPGAQVIDVSGKTVMPGLVDVHAHLHFTAADILPEQEWRYLTALDFGVTTVHDPSAFTDLVFTQAERVAAGLEQGPRVFSTGGVLYGALSADGAKTADLDAARGHLRRLAAVGASSVKVYQQSQRERRQWYSVACAEEHILCVPEGGGDLWMDLGMIVDGYQAIEHAFPTTPLYADVVGLIAGSTKGGDGLGTFHTPTLMVAYGGMPAKHWYFQHLDPFSNERLRRHTPSRWLDAGLWRLGHQLRDEDWRFQSTARDEGSLVRAGAHVTLGAHGELQGLGPHYELWALGGRYGDQRDPGAMSTWEALRAGTIEGARYLGLQDAIGTVEVGKLADLIVLEGDPLADLYQTANITFVVANGVVHR
jgi:Amidohydrolase family